MPATPPQQNRAEIGRICVPLRDLITQPWDLDRGRPIRTEDKLYADDLHRMLPALLVDRFKMVARRNRLHATAPRRWLRVRRLSDGQLSSRRADLETFVDKN